LKEYNSSSLIWWFKDDGLIDVETSNLFKDLIVPLRNFQEILERCLIEIDECPLDCSVFACGQSLIIPYIFYDWNDLEMIW
jgi:hypothetical protein